MTYQVMTHSRWLQIVADNAKKLRQFVGSYHPSAREPDTTPMVISAPSPEAACQNVREAIRKERPDDPLARWDKALAAGDISELNSLLSDAWFGVPESTECWSIPGFGIACDLMDDLPEEDEVRDGD
jgi:hypothetical protein